MRKLHDHLKAVKEAAVERNLPQAKPITLTPQEQSLDEDLNEAAQVRARACLLHVIHSRLRLLFASAANCCAHTGPARLERWRSRLCGLS